jgi:lysozyme family protein
VADKIDAMIDDVLRREGGFVDHPADRGGPTKYGITQRTLGHYLGRAVDRAEVEALGRPLAAEIYRRNYLLVPRLDTLPERIKAFLFDSAVNHGPRRAVRLLQQVCAAAGFTPIAIDGVLGPQTRARARDADAAMGIWLLAALVAERRSFYRQIVARDPSQAVFFKGWMNRLAEFDHRMERLMA